MIFTECPTCNEPQVIGWESGDGSGFFPCRCPKCNEVMWIDATLIGGITRSHADFKTEVMKPGDDEAIDSAAERAEVLSSVIYE